MKQKRLHMIGNAHIDPVWLWRWQEGYHEVLATFRSVLDRMQEDEAFTFACSSASFYEWVEQSDPAMFAEIQQRVDEGRWEIVGGWWVQPDCNLPAGESFARHALYAQRYFLQRFGKTATVGYNVDSFGHNAMLPQLLQQGGLHYYLFMRPGPHEKGLPGRLFWWEADDGSRVLTSRLPFAYCTWGAELDNHVRRCAAEMRAPFNELPCFYGVGNHGGGPTRENLASIHRLAADPSLPALSFSTPARYFQEVAANELPIPVVHDELQHHASGCYAAHSAVKRWNREGENRLLQAEKLATVAHALTGHPYPRDLDRAWKNVLFNQFHDILAGTSIATAYDDARDLHGEAMAIAGRALNGAQQALAWQIRIPEEAGTQPLVVFNPHGWETRTTVEVEIEGGEGSWMLVDEESRPLPLQRLQPQATAPQRSRFCFTAMLPSLGYRLYRLLPGEGPTFPAIKASDTVLDNGRIRLEIDPESGAMRSLRDHNLGLELLAGPAALPVVLDDQTDTWGHNVFSFNQVAGTFGQAHVKLVAHGPVKSVLQVTSSYGSSRLRQDFTMYPDRDQIDVEVTVDWHEQFKLLKLRFPLNLSFMRAVHEIPYGHIERAANGEEEPIQRWLDVSGTSRDTGDCYGLSILNDGKYSADVNVRDIGLTVLRSPIYAHHLPVEPESGNSYDFIDQGRQTFTYSLVPHAGSWEEAGTVRRAAELNQRPQTLLATYHPRGTLPPVASYLRVDQENVDVTVLKQAEDGDDLILRCHETARVATTATIELPLWQRTFTGRFRPCEIKTWRIPRDPALPVHETNFLEGLPAAAATETAQPVPVAAKQAGHNGQQPSNERLRRHPAGVIGNEQRPDHRQQFLQRHPELAGCLDAVTQATTLLAACFRGGGKLLLCGNGGSAADCEHLVGELMKGYLLPRPIPASLRRQLETALPEDGPALAAHLQGALPAISLVSQAGLISATANDVSPAMIFAQQVYGYGRPGDVVAGISTSGNSQNVIRALQVARAMGLSTLAFTGADGGALRELADVLIAAPARLTAAVQEQHLALYHLLSALLEEEFFVTRVAGTSNGGAENDGYAGEEVETNGQSIPS